jgi:hypothetical protein
MTLPGFTAEASSSVTGRHYRSSSREVVWGHQLIRQQQLLGGRCDPRPGQTFRGWCNLSCFVCRTSGDLDCCANCEFCSPPVFVTE